MAEDSNKPAFDFSDPNIHTVYANDTAAIVGDTESIFSSLTGLHRHKMEPKKG